MRSRTSKIRKRAGKERTDDIPDCVDGIHDTCRRGSFFQIETKVLAVLSVAVYRPHKRTVVAVYTRVEHRHADTPVELINIRQTLFVHRRPAQLS